MGNFNKVELRNQNRSGRHNSSLNQKLRLEPFRLTDNVMVLGRYKGRKITEVPTSYLRWMMKSMDMCKTRALIVKDTLIKAL